MHRTTSKATSRSSLLPSVPFALAAIVCATACSPQAKISGEMAGEEVSLSHGKAESLPSEEPGRTLVFRDYGAQCNGPADPGDSLLFVDLTMTGENFPSELPAGTYSIGENELDGFKVVVGSGFMVVGSNEILNANSGSVEIESSNKSVYSGTVDLKFPDDDHLSGQFDVPTCERP